LIQRRANSTNPISAYLSRRSVRSLLLVVVAATLIPVFLISFAQAYARLANDRHVVRQNLTDRVALAADQALNVIALSEQALISLSVRDDVRQAQPTCAQSLAIAQLAMPLTRNLARINERGIITCSAQAILMSPDMRNRAWLPSLAKSDVISYAGPTVEGVSGKPVLIVGLGMEGGGGQNIGHIVAGIDLEKLEQALQKRGGIGGSQVKLVNQAGIPVQRLYAKNQTTSQDIDIISKALPQGYVAGTRDQSGNLWTYARAPVVAGHLYVVYLRPDSVSYAATFWHVATDIALPLIALILASAGLWFAIQIWAIVPIESLRSLAHQYAVGRFNFEPPELANGPLEMKELRNDMISMAHRARNRDDRLKRVAEQKDILVKELHHRVKNNLQIIISLISLQARQSETPEQRASLEGIHARIAAMALVQRLVVETDNSASISVAVLLEELCSLVRRTFVADSGRVPLRFESDTTQIPDDMATPFALFAFEAVTNAFRHGFKDGKSGQIVVRFAAQDGGQGRLEICDTGSGWTEPNKRSGTGHKLLQGFARQLRGTLDMSTHPTDGSRISVSFDCKSEPAIPNTEPVAL
jgi:two-component sensor histidine kinase